MPADGPDHDILIHTPRAVIKEAGSGGIQMKYDELNDFRESIDNIDAALVFLLAERFRVTGKVGNYKKKNNLPSRDAARENRQVARLNELSGTSGMDRGFLKKIFRLITDEVVRRHDSIRDNT